MLPVLTIRISYLLVHLELRLPDGVQDRYTKSFSLKKIKSFHGVTPLEMFPATWLTLPRVQPDKSHKTLGSVKLDERNEMFSSKDK